MKKAKKILSLVLVAALVVSVCLMGGILNASAAATVIDEGNLLLNGSFEQTYDVNLGFTDLEIKNGQTNYVGVDAWRYWKHWWVENNVPIAEKKIYATHFTDAHSGSFALKFTNSGTGETDESSVIIYPNKVVGEDATAFATGNYRFSVWVKGTNTASSIVYTNAAGTKNTVNISDVKADEWTQVVIENIAGFSTVDREPTNPNVPETVLDLNFVINTQDTATEILFDDVRLEKAVVIADPNILKNSSFEEFLGDASDNVLIDNGQTIHLATNWYGCEHWIEDKTDKRVTINHSTDAHSGTYSLKFSMPASGEGFRIITNEIDGNVTELSGEYELSFWVKGNNPNLKLYEIYYDTAQSKNVKVELKAFTVTNEWTKVTCTIPEIKYYLHNYSNDWPATDYKETLGLYLYMKGTTDASEIYIDDICLEKVEETSNVIIENSFEVPQNDATEEYTISYTGNQTTKPLQGWAFHTGSKKAHVEYANHIKSAQSGDWAIEFKIKDAETVGNNSWETETIYPTPTNINEEKLTAGKYVLSIWVKGNNTKAYLGFGNTKVYVPATAANGWQKITISDITINSVDDLGLAGTGAGSDAYRYKNIKFVIPHNPSTTIAFDNICLELADTVNDVKDQITGIKQPAVGATELELPVLDTNNDAITVSIAESSNEDVIALGGTIKTPKMQTVVDVTLKISDGTNTVTLEPIGVLVHGELDTVTQAVIEAAIEALNVKADSAEVDIAEIDGWLEYKGSYVSKASKNIFAQKKLVFEFDKSGDTVLDNDDIVAVREELLGENAEEYTIRDLVKTFNKVVEYNSLAQ